MSMSNKVFIYNAKGSCPESVSDFQELFSSNSILNHPDVITSDLNFNFSGLTHPTFVIPAGAAGLIGKAILPYINKAKLYFGDHFNCVGICAGAFGLAADGDLFRSWCSSDTVKIANPISLFSLSDIDANVAIIDDYKAIGSFFPNNSYSRYVTPKDDMPYAVTLSLCETQQKITQLYVSGPGFFCTNNRPQTEVVATYADQESYTFSYDDTKNRSINNMPAIIRRKANDNRGGVLLSGVHLEANVKNSQFLRIFKTSTSHTQALNAIDYKNLETNQKESQAMTEELLRNTLR